MLARLRAASVLALVALLVVSGLSVAISPVGAAAPTSTPGAATNASQDTNVTFRDIHTSMVIDIRPSGNARWTVTKTTTLSNGSDVAEFEDAAEEYENGELSVLPVASFRAASRQVSGAVGREMAIKDVNRSYQMGTDTGSLVLTFTWTNFGEKQGDRLHIEDVFNGSHGRWFPSLAENQTLVVTIPPGYDPSGASRGATLQNQTFRWEGPVLFGPDTPYIFYVKSTLPPTDSPTPSVSPSPTTTAGPGPGPDNTGDGMVIPVLVVLLIGALAVLGYVATRVDGQVIQSTGEREASDGDDEPDDGPASMARDAAVAGGAAAAETDDESEADEEDGVDEELLSDEERVERLIERNGGRMKQANIVSETGWSNAKVSQLLSSMDEAGRIEKLRIGRENLISFPDRDVEDDS